MRIHMDLNSNVIKTEVLTASHESGFHCSRDASGVPVDASGRIAQDAFDAQSAARLVAQQNSNAQQNNDFNGAELITSPKFAGEQ